MPDARALDYPRPDRERAATPPPLDLRDRIARQLAETSPDEITLRNRMDEVAGELGKSTPGFSTFDLHSDLFGSVFDLDKAVFRLAWPSGLFIPGGADWKQFWFLPPPAGQNRFTEQWMGGNGAGANQASAETGALFAYAAARPTDVHLRSEASVGVVFLPTLALATYKITANLSLTGSDRYWVETTAPAGGSVRKWGAVDLSAWEINPANGTTDLVRPFGSKILFDETFSNLTGTPINTFSLSPSFSTNIMLEGGGGRAYVIGVTALVDIQNDWTTNQGGAMMPLPPGSVWKMWCSIAGTVASLSIDPEVIYQH